MPLNKIIARIVPLDKQAMAVARARQGTLTKPAGSLGRLEEISIQLAGITREAAPHVKDKVVTIMAGDHGVVAEGVSAYPSEVTSQMVYNFLNGGAAINVLASHVGARVVVVDMGVAVDLPPHPDLINNKVAHGTGNIARGPAMTREQAVQALLAGAAVLETEMEKGLDVLATGDMGIGNTTPSAAVAVALTGYSASAVVGRGTGVDDHGLERKIAAVDRALTINQPDPDSGLDVLSKLGGFEIAGLAGAVLAAAAHRRPVVVDGFISTAAAMIAVSLCPQVLDYLFAAHCSVELGHRLMLEWLGLEPILDLNLRLGEGTGAVLAVSLLEASSKILRDMATFAEAGVSEKDPERESA